MTTPPSPASPDSSRFAPPSTTDATPPAESPAPPISAQPEVQAPTLSAQHEERAIIQRIQEEIRKVFIGQDALVEMVLATFISGGHLLIEGHPGLGKTHLVLSLAKAFQGEFKRIQFTPDLMPSDVVGHSLYNMGSQEFQIKHGPVFTNLLLADEINRAPAKTQSALLEVMQERQATIDGATYPLPRPFMVLATQNPIEHDGTYPLPEAQLDRFMMKLLVTEPSLQTEIEIATRATHSGATNLHTDQITPVTTPTELSRLQVSLQSQQISPEVIAYAVQIVQATRESDMTSYGASPRASIALIQAAKGLSLLRDRDYVTPDDIKHCALPVLRHRISLTSEVSISGQTVDETVLTILNGIQAPRGNA